MLAVDVTTTPTFTASQPKLLFQKGYQGNPIVPYRNYDVSPDGQRFIMVGLAEQQLASIIVVLNWFEELKRLVPTGE